MCLPKNSDNLIRGVYQRNDDNDQNYVQFVVHSRGGFELTPIDLCARHNFCAQDLCIDCAPQKNTDNLIRPGAATVKLPHIYTYTRATHMHVPR